MSHWNDEAQVLRELWSKHYPDEQAYNRAVAEYRERVARYVRVERIETATLPASVRDAIVDRKLETTDATDAVRDVCEMARKARGACSLLLVLSGGVGSGKTVAACTALADCGGSYVVPDELYRRLFRRKVDDEMPEPVVGPVIVLDDLGTETDARFSVALLELVNRTLSDRTTITIITTNLTREQIAARYDARIIDRINSAATLVTLAGASLRKNVCGL